MYKLTKFLHPRQIVSLVHIFLAFNVSYLSDLFAHVFVGSMLQRAYLFINSYLVNNVDLYCRNLTFPKLSVISDANHWLLLFMHISLLTIAAPLNGAACIQKLYFEHLDYQIKNA